MAHPPVGDFLSSLRSCFGLPGSFREHFLKKGIDILGFYCCLHHPDFNGACGCRKPKPGLFNEIEKDWLIDKEKSIMIGDSQSDIIAGESFGVSSLRVCN